MKWQENWRSLSVLGISFGLLLLSVLLPLPAADTALDNNAAEDEYSRALEKSTRWLKERENRFDLKVELADDFLQGELNKAALSEDLIGFAFRTVCLFKNGEPIVWTRYAPSFPGEEDGILFVSENGQALAQFQKTIKSSSDSASFVLVGISVLSGPVLIPDDNALPSLEMNLHEEGVAVSISAAKLLEPTRELTQIFEFDRVQFLENRLNRTHRLRVVVLFIWLLVVAFTAFFVVRPLSSGVKVLFVLHVFLVVGLWLWPGAGFESISAVFSIPTSEFVLLRFTVTSVLVAGALMVVTGYFLAVRRLFGVVWYPRTIFFSVLYGVLAALTWLYLPAWLSYPLQSETVQPFAVSLTTNSATVFYFGGVLFSFLPTLLFFTILGWFLFGTEQDQITWVSPLMIGGFALVIGAYIKFSSQTIDNWLIISVIGVFALIKQLAYKLYTSPKRFAFLSRVRLIAAACALTVLWTYWFIYSGYRAENVARMELTANKIMIEHRAVADHLARVLPRYILRKIAFSSLYEQSDELNTAIDEMAKPEWSIFEISIYRVDEGKAGQLLYSNIRFKQPPGILNKTEALLQTWDPAADVMHIKLDLVEPITVGFVPAGENGSGLVALVRPKYQQSDGTFDLVFEPDAFGDWTSFSAAVYKGNTLTHRFFHGVKKPDFNPDPLLPEIKVSGGLIPEIAANGYRNLTYRFSSQESLVLSYRDLGFSAHVYSAVRFYLTLVVYLLGIYVVLMFASRRFPEILTSRQKLQFRILDSYILSSLVFLVLLIIVTQFVVRRLAEQDFRDAFEQRLENYRQGLSSSNYSDWLNYEYEGDYLLYEGPYLIQSSRERLTENGRLPGTLPFSLYNLMLEEKQPRFIQSFAIAGNPFLAGIIRISQPDNVTPLFVVFPALQDFDEQSMYLFRTTSFLIIVYVSMFGLFIVGAAMISRHLSRPLADLSAGLRKVATGEFSATVPVTTQDEVGDLANAYNLMIYKLQDLQKELSEVERQAALSEMARQVAHEIKNPLTPMKLSIQFLQRQIMQRDQPIEELQAAVDRICKTVVEQIDSLNVIASDFSRFAKPLAGSFRKIDLNKISTDIIDLYRHDRRINIISDLYEKPLYVNGIGDEIKRVLINLVKNSDEAMPDGGVIIVRTYPYKEQMFIEIVDNGSGIPVEQQARLFTPNFSTKTSGTGLGLAICKKVVEAHKGEISFASVEGAGTTFTLVFPAWKETDGAQLALGDSDFL